MHDTLEARPVFPPCQILSLGLIKFVQPTLWPFQVGMPSFGTAILGFSQGFELIAGHQSAMFSKGWVCGGGVCVVCVCFVLFLNTFVQLVPQLIICNCYSRDTDDCSRSCFRDVLF